MKRKAVTEQELVQVINSELKKSEECVGCQVKGIMILSELDAEGCNWDYVSLSCSDRPANRATPVWQHRSLPI